MANSRNRLRFLLVDDDRSDRGLVKRFLTKEFEDPEIREVETRAQFLVEIADPPDLIVSDYLLRGFNGLEVLEILREKDLDVPVVLLTGTGNEEIAIEAMKKGVADYVIKTIEHIKRLPATIEHVLRLRQIEQERRVAEEELLLSDQILNYMPDTVILTDLEGRIVRWTGSAEGTFGYRASEAIGHSFKFLLANWQEGAGRTGDWEEFDQPKEALCRRRDSSTFQAELTSRHLYDKEGKPNGIVMVYRDITERKKMEEALREHTEHLGRLVQERTKKIEELQRQKSAMEKLAATGQMAARVAHEINNPLAGIKNAFTLIRRDIPPDSKYGSYVELIKKEIDRIAGIIQQMYKTYSPKAGRPNHFNLATTISDVCRLLTPKAKQHNLLIDTQMPEETVSLFQPEGELNQILYNLILNAIQASHSGEKIKVSLEKKGQSVAIRVSDSGRGISPENLNKIFEPFFTTKKTGAQGGLGLGLAVSQNLAQAMGGSISVESAENRGATFTLTLPITCRTEMGKKEMANV
ncbi:MAG: PAS domain S-box protein [Candidatus Omnitrophica bacterium]|nr:PAS domain S-box protein [Candidatus Omnitrophota bacterium]MCA9415391.1 PAS domain S-box protein [Candidatus Omnitrophota bacterium]MCA9429202.1 PAS domain S-box protein [Candidatus Omnitrophota bacterium]MCA9444759.1 PAS domain S-box protein [Candidatus Omnitrophota bacterium]